MALRLLLIITLFYSTTCNAKQFLAIDSEPLKKGLTQFSLHLFDSESETIQKSVDVSSGINRGVKSILSANENYAVLLIPAKKKKDHGTVSVFDAKNLSLISSFKLPPLSYSLYLNNSVYHTNSLFTVTDDETKVIASVLQNKKHFLQTYDLKTGELIDSIGFGKTSIIAKTNLNKTRVLAYNYKGSKRQINIINILNGKKLHVSSLSKNVTSVDVAGNYFVIHKKVKMKNSTIRSLLIGNLETGKMMDYSIKSKKSVIHYYHEKEGVIYLAWLDQDKHKRLSVSKITADGEIIQITQTGEKLDPVHISVNEENDKLLILGKNRIMSINLKDKSNLVGKLPFDATLGFFNKHSDKAYIREGNGSEVAIIDLNNMKTINRSGTGRAGVKFGQILLSTAGVAIGAYSGYFNILTYKSDTAMIVDDSETNLFVINSRTNDVTIFNADDLSNRHEQATGRGSFGVMQIKSENENNENKPVLTFSPEKLSFFNPKTTELTLQIDIELLSGLDIEHEVLFNTTKEGLIVISLIDGRIIRKYENFSPLKILNKSVQ